MSYRHHLLPLLACLVWGGAMGLVDAAPLKPSVGGQEAHQAANTQAVDAQAQETGTDWADGAVPGTGRTMHLLLEMQKKDPGPPPQPSAAAPARPAIARPPANALGARPAEGAVPGGSRAVPSAPSEQPAAAPVLFGATQAPAIRSTASPSVDWQATVNGGNAVRQKPQRPSGEMQRWLGLPAEFIAWLRQNRYAVVAGAVVTLVLAWVGSAVIGRRRYA